MPLHVATCGPKDLPGRRGQPQARLNEARFALIKDFALWIVLNIKLRFLSSEATLPDLMQKRLILCVAVCSLAALSLGEHLNNNILHHCPAPAPFSADTSLTISLRLQPRTSLFSGLSSPMHPSRLLLATP